MKNTFLAVGFLFVCTLAFGQQETEREMKAVKIEKKLFEEKKAEPAQVSGELEEGVADPKETNKEQAPRKMETNFARPE